MATLTTKTDDAGKPISYKFTCCVGRDDNGKQVWRTKTVKSPHYTEAKEKRGVPVWETPLLPLLSLSKKPERRRL